MPSPSASIAARVGENLARERRRAGLSQEAVGYRASLHRTEIGLLERGERTPRIDTAIKLAGALEVELAQLVEGIAWSPGSIRLGGFDLPARPEPLDGPVGR
jgi:transcriptional regulator with XRE-family HTH domain